MFVHIGVIHVAMNMIGLWQVGLLVERLLGTRGFLLAYFVSGLCGSLASVAWNPFVVSAGASGAVFGIYGVLIAYLVRHRGTIPKEILRPLQQSTVFFIGLNVIYGFQIKGIDMAAHIGGLVGGFAAALLIGRAPTGGRQNRTSRELLMVAIAAGGIAAAVASLPRVADIQAELNAFGAMERAAVAAYNDALERSRSGQLTDAGLAAVIDKEVLPPWRNQQQRLTAISRLPPNEKKRFADLGRYLSLRDRGWSKLSEALRTDDRGKVDEAVALLKEADKLLASASEK
jgi:rhomboid protease GluP